jgi:hypothetical protein
MKYFVLIFGVFLYSQGNSQDFSALNRKIDSLIKIKLSYESKLKSLNDNIAILEREKQVSVKKSIGQQRDKSFYVIVNNDTKMYYESSLSSDEVWPLKKGDTLELISYDNSGFYEVKDKVNHTGYVLEGRFYESDATTIFKEYKLQQDSIVNAEQAKADAALSKAKAQQAKQLAVKSDEKKKIAKAERKSKLVQKYGEKVANKILEGKVWIGMTKEMAIESWGKPDDINKTVTASTVNEQWVYGIGQYLYFDNGFLTTIQN